MDKSICAGSDVTAQEYTDAMTLSGTKVEGFEKMDADLDRIVVGQIDKIEKHPDADKLIICQVNIGTETNSDRYRCSECKRRRQGTGCSGRRTCGRRSRAWTACSRRYQDQER